MKKAIAIFITLVLTTSMVLSMAVPVFATPKSVEDVGAVIKAHAGDIAGIKIKTGNYINAFDAEKVGNKEYFEITESEVKSCIDNDIKNKTQLLKDISTNVYNEQSGYLYKYIGAYVSHVWFYVVWDKYGNESNQKPSELTRDLMLNDETVKINQIKNDIMNDLESYSQGSIFSNNPSMPFLVVMVAEAIAIVALIVMNRRKSLLLQKNGLLAEKE